MIALLCHPLQFRCKMVHLIELEVSRHWQTKNIQGDAMWEEGLF